MVFKNNGIIVFVMGITMVMPVVLGLENETK